MSAATKKYTFFNLDLHVSVIEDVKYICQKLYGDSIEIVNWSISTHNWVFGKEDKDVQFINKYTWPREFNTENIKKFNNTYGKYLKTFDGFIVTHTPIFATIFAEYEKPIIILNSCRYEQPFSFEGCVDFYAWRNLNKILIKLYKKGNLILISNNLADNKYIELGTSISSKYIPSLCKYTHTYHTPKINKAVVIGNNIFKSDDHIIEKPSKISWEELYSYKAIIHVPYEISTISIFEQYSAGVPLFFPSRKFYEECIINGKMDLISRYINIGPNNINECLNSDTFWLDRADYYTWMKNIYYYDNEDDLIHKIIHFKETDDVVLDRKKHLLSHEKDILSKWQEVWTELLSKIEERKDMNNN